MERARAGGQGEAAPAAGAARPRARRPDSQAAAARPARAPGRLPVCAPGDKKRGTDFTWEPAPLVSIWNTPPKPNPTPARGGLPR